MMKKSMILLWLVVTICSLTGCRGYEDIAQSISNSSIVLPVKEAAYGNVVWVNNSLMAFLYSPTLPKDIEGIQPLLYHLEIKEEQLVELPIPEDSNHCRKAGVHILDRLPDGNLGFIERCFFGDKITGEAYTLFIWDVQSQAIVRSHPYPINFRAWAFSFAPDIARFVQENGIGPELNNELYWCDFEGCQEQLVSKFKRARSPAWSPDGATLAFVGTESHEGTITSLGDIEDLLYRPWDLYLMDADGANLRLVLTGIQFAQDLKWLPQRNQLSFTGVFKSKEGIWVFDLDTKEIIRIWPYRTSYDWSPDGARMVILAKDVEGQKYPHPVIVEIPENLFTQPP